MQIGLGRLRFNPSVFYDMTFEEFCAAATGMNKEEEMRQQQEWERTRWLASVILQPHAKKGTRLKPTDIAKFPWDKKPKGKSDSKLLAATIKRLANA